MDYSNKGIMTAYNGPFAFLEFAVKDLWGNPPRISSSVYARSYGKLITDILTPINGVYLNKIRTDGKKVRFILI